MFGNIGPWELAFIIIIALIVIGPGKLPEAGKALGQAFRSFNKAKDDMMRDFDTTTNEAHTEKASDNNTQ